MVNNASDGLFTLGLILFTLITVYGISFYRTQDVSKSSTIGLMMASFITIILYYMGYNGGYDVFYTGEEFVSSVLLFTVVILTVLTVTGVKYFKKGE